MSSNFIYTDLRKCGKTIIKPKLYCAIVSPPTYMIQGFFATKASDCEGYDIFSSYAAKVAMILNLSTTINRISEMTSDIINGSSYMLDNKKLGELQISRDLKNRIMQIRNKYCIRDSTYTGEFIPADSACEWQSITPTPDEMITEYNAKQKKLNNDAESKADAKAKEYKNQHPECDYAYAYAKNERWDVEV